MEQFPANSHKTRAAPDETKPDQKKVEKIVEGDVVRRKTPLGKRFAQTFFGGDAKGVVAYIVMDVLIPAAKDTVADAFSQGIERMLFGEVRSTSRRTGQRPGGASGYTNYNRYSSPSGTRESRREDPRNNISRRARSSHDFDEIILATRAEATEVVDRLFDLIAKYETATVADLYELVGVSGNYTDDKWGWTDIRGAGVTRVRNGYLLDLPKPEPLD
jgi:hypothetical protein